MVEISRNEDGTLSGQGEWTEGERAYARSRGYISTPDVPGTPTNPPAPPSITLDNVTSIAPGNPGNPGTQRTDDGPTTFDLSDVQ